MECFSFHDSGWVSSAMSLGLPEHIAQRAVLEASLATVGETALRTAALGIEISALSTPSHQLILAVYSAGTGLACELAMI